MTQILLTQLKPAHSPNRNQSVNSRAKLTVRFLRRGISYIKLIKYKFHDNNERTFADTFFRVMKKHKRFYVEKNIATLKQICKESLKNILLLFLVQVLL